MARFLFAVRAAARQFAMTMFGTPATAPPPPPRDLLPEFVRYHAALHALPSLHRAAFELHCVNRHPVHEVAESLNVPDETVEVLLGEAVLHIWRSLDAD